MSETVLKGRGEIITEVSLRDWEQEVRNAPRLIGRRLEFMSPEHHAVRNFVVRELPSRGRSISIEVISSELGLPHALGARIVRELEANLFFLARPGRSEISWGFPVTVDDTGHRLLFSTGERLDAA